MSSRLALAAALVAVSSTFLFAADELKEAKVGEITLKTPASWKQSEPTSKLRLAQFEIPAAEGDKEAAELAIFSFGGGGGVQANVDRWIEQFQADGRKSKVTTGKSDLGQYVFVDVTGTYKKPVGPPVLGKTEALPGARMLAAILAVEGKGNFFLKLTGENATVSAAAEPFRVSFGGKEADEKPFGGE
jgi:gluconolactonase